MSDQNQISSPQLRTGFYVTGGTLRLDAACYVVRSADEELYLNLQTGVLCYVLTSRQMGKSSLMVRTATRLSKEGVRVAVLDLTSIGNNLTAEQWYGGLLLQIGRRLNLEDELLDFWESRSQFGPLQRWMDALSDCVLQYISDPLVIFIDEIDAVRSLPFSTDEFFAGIRELYNRRAQNQELQRLTFCLLGVALPSDLIQNAHLTPFNIGRRIILTDFSPDEASSLAAGLEVNAGNGTPLLARVLYWTGGHPYLTQRLCQSLVEKGACHTSQDVDQICSELFLTGRAKTLDDNLLYVRERILRSGDDLPHLLNLYERVHRKKVVADDASNRLIGLLRLSGIARTENGRLQVRNRIYEQAFDRAWIQESMPDAEKRRQRAAYRRGIYRASILAGIIIAVMIMLVAYSLRQRSVAVQAKLEAVSRELATNSIAQLTLDPDLSAVLAIEAWRRAPTVEAEYALRQAIPAPWVGPVLRGHTDAITSVRFSPDGKRILTASADATARLWSAETGELSLTLRGHHNALASAEFSPDGHFVLTASADSTAILWDAENTTPITYFRGHAGRIDGAVFSPDGELVLTTGLDHTVRLWETRTGKQLFSLRGHKDLAWNGAFSRDGMKALTASSDKTSILWSVKTGKSLFTLRGHTEDVGAAFSPDSRYVVTWSSDGTANIWEVASGLRLVSVRGSGAGLNAAAFAMDNRFIATGSNDGAVHIWDAGTGRGIAVLEGHQSKITGIRFTPDGKLLVTSSLDGTARIWELETGHAVAILHGHTKGLNCAPAISPDGNLVVTGSKDTTARIWKLRQNYYLKEFIGHTSQTLSAAFSTDGHMLVTTALEPDRSVRVWDADSGRQLYEFAVPPTSFRNACFSPDGNRVATASVSSDLYLSSSRDASSLQIFHSMDTAILDAAYSPDGKQILLGCLDGTVRVWDAVSGQELQKFSEHSARVVQVAFSPDGSLAASAGFDKSVCIWDLRNNSLVSKLSGHQAEVYSVAFGRNGKWVATGGADEMVAIWEVGSWSKLQELTGHPAGVRQVDFNSNDTFLVTSGFDGTVQIWDLQTGKRVSQFNPGSTEISRAVFKPEHNDLIAVSGGRTVRLYTCEACLPVNDLIRLIQSRSSRQFTPAERKKFLHE